MNNIKFLAATLFTVTIQTCTSFKHPPLIIIRSINSAGHHLHPPPPPLTSSAPYRGNGNPYTSLATVQRVRGGALSVAPALTLLTEGVNGFFVSFPYTAAALTCGVKASAADYVAQRRHLSKRDGSFDYNDKNKLFDIKRNIAFLVYGSLYQGICQEFIYNHLYSSWFGSGTSVGVVAMKVAFDLLIQTTLLTLPVAYLLKAIVFQYSLVEGLRRYKEDITNNGLLTKFFALWAPVQCFTFSVVPEHFRITFIAVVSFFWLIILSTIQARPRFVEEVTIVGQQRTSDEKQQVEGIPFQQIEEEIDMNIEECSLLDGTTCNIDG